MDMVKFNILYSYVEELRYQGMLEDSVKKMEKVFLDGLYKLEAQITPKDFVHFENIALDMLTIIKYEQIDCGKVKRHHCCNFK